MTTFSWKRKIGENISKDTSLKFSADSEVEVEYNAQSLERYKRKKEATESNRKIQAEVHKNRGIEFAQSNRFQEAVHEFDKSLGLYFRNEKVLEMKAQALLQLNQPFPAVQVAEKAVKLNPQWWVAHQTLGRCQLGIGDLKMAKVSFSKAIHLNPAEKELWEDDLKWTVQLIEKENKLSTLKLLNEEAIESENPDPEYDEDGCIISPVLKTLIQ